MEKLMNNDLLVSLRNYRPREGKDPLENFVTEAFAWLLKNFDGFSVYFIQAVASKIGIDSKLSYAGAKWTTQANFNGFFPDMLAEFDNIAFVFENKAWAHLHDKQLKNYREYAKEHYKTSYIILITATSSQHDQNPDIALCWSDIYSLIKKWIDSLENKPEFIFYDFLRLLEYEGMGPPSPISHESILSYYPARNFKSQVSAIIQRVEHENWGELVPLNDFNLFIEKKRGLCYGEAWGRIGIHLFGGNDSDWRPGVFVGFLIDGEDHCTTPLSVDKGPDFSIIIDFDEPLHNQYPHHHLYDAFINRVSSEIAKLETGWNFYHHLEDQSAEQKNEWHPIHIRQPMLELFRGTLTAEEQAVVFLNNAKEILHIVFQGNEIKQLREQFL